MSPNVFSCVVCGYLIYDHIRSERASWLNQFRILYTSINGIAVTGVGIYSDPDSGDWIAPLDYAGRWDDADYDFPPDHQIGVLGQSPFDDRYGYPFHASCWSLLEASYNPNPLPNERLFEVCQSLPFRGSVDWGHYFNGFCVEHNSNRYPWEDRLLKPNIQPSIFSIAITDSFNVPEITRLPYNDPQEPQLASLKLPQTTFAHSINLLPGEICMYIASYMSTRDALNTRLVSRSFISLFYQSQFWISRFGANTERDWLLESREWTKQSDWRWIYRLIHDTLCSNGMKNRKRIWILIEHIRQVLSLQFSRPTLPPATPSDASSSVWSIASADLRTNTSVEPYHTFGEGCRMFHEIEISIPRALDHISFSTVLLGDSVYLTGMRLVTDDDKDVKIGYNGNGTIGTLPNRDLVGFNLAVGSRGIQDIQCICKGGEVTPWIQSANNIPKTKRLATVSTTMIALRAGFDGCKMVSLAISERRQVIDERDDRNFPTLRESAFWYPDIPDQRFHLNDASFAALHTATTRYQPLCWKIFRGEKGIRLKHLTRVSVSLLSTVRNIEFHYSEESSVMVGRPYDWHHATVMNFDIDGPGGETINSIEV